MPGTSFTVGPRVEFDLGHYPRLRVWNPDTQQDCYLYLHRLTAFAQGQIEDLTDDRHVHHVDGDRWNNRPENLEALTPEEHERRHDHRVVADGGLTPRSALEEYGTLYRNPTSTSDTVHLSKACNDLTEDHLTITHPGQIPLGAGVCAYCDPDEDTRPNRDPAKTPVPGGRR